MIDLSFLKQENLENGGLFIIICGPPSSGKSTLSQAIKNEFDNFEIISPDVIREELTGDMNDQSQNKYVFEKVYTRIAMYLDEGYNIIYDATNCRPVHRHKVLSACKKIANKIICIVMTTPMATCLKQNEERNRIVPEDVIERMYISLRNHPPTVFEGYDLIVKA